MGGSPLPPMLKVGVSGSSPLLGLSRFWAAHRGSPLNEGQQADPMLERAIGIDEQL
jgi:hypothetical protein